MRCAQSAPASFVIAPTYPVTVGLPASGRGRLCDTESQAGSIQIADSHALVEVPEAAADEIARVLGAAKIKGKRLEVRRYRER